MLKVRFQFFSFASKKVQWFSSDKTVSQFFEILIFSQDIYGNVHYVPEINLISEGTLIKAFISQTKQFKRNLRHGFVDDRQLKTIMPI